MQRATSIVRKPAVKPERVIDTVTLDHEGRLKRRIVLQGDQGTGFLLDLERATQLNDGDGLKLEDGSLIAVKAAPEALLEIKADNPLRLLRVAWHIGNRHTPAELTADALYIQDDHVLAEMVRGQGCQISHVLRPFQPEAGAHAHGEHDHQGHDAHGLDCGCGHDHSHDHSHDHAHDHGHGDHHGHAHAHSHAHGHTDDCGCGHDHHHDHSHSHQHEHKHD